MYFNNRNVNILNNKIENHHYFDHLVYPTDEAWVIYVIGLESQTSARHTLTFQ